MKGNLFSRLQKKIDYALALRKFRLFEKGIHPLSLQMHDEVARWATSCVEHSAELEKNEIYESADDPVVRQGHKLAEEKKKEFRNKCGHLTGVRILAYLPSPSVSPAGYSLITNLLQSLNYIGIQAEALREGESIEQHLDKFAPTVFLIGDYAPFLAGINWRAVAHYRNTNEFKLGLTASLEEYGNTPLPQRLAWAGEHGVDFYFSFRSPEYTGSRREYKPFFESGYSILTTEFGANPLLYYPVPGIRRDLDYVFLASSNQDKWDRYFAFLKDIFASFPGYVDGPGWSFAGNFTFEANRDRYLYARAKVGINLHIVDQIEQACELNERTYMLAACGVPQLIDNPKLLSMRFSTEGFFVADTPAQYRELFDDIVNGGIDTTNARLIAQKEVMERHTTFHRAEGFVLKLNNMFEGRG